MDHHNPWPFLLAQLGLSQLAVQSLVLCPSPWALGLHIFPTRFKEHAFEHGREQAVCGGPLLILTGGTTHRTDRGGRGYFCSLPEKRTGKEEEV